MKIIILIHVDEDTRFFNGYVIQVSQTRQNSLVLLLKILSFTMFYKVLGHCEFSIGLQNNNSAKMILFRVS